MCSNAVKCHLKKQCLNLELHRPLLVFLRRRGGNLRRSTRRELLLRESGVQPTVRAWLRSCVQLWNRAADLPPTDPLGVAMHENALMQYRPKQLWCVVWSLSCGVLVMPCPTGRCRFGEGASF
jgi:hypothetical protein